MTDLLQVEVYLLRLIIPAVYWVKSLLACIMKNNIRAGRDLFMEKGQVRYRKGTPADLDDICSMIRDAVAEMEQSGIHQWDEHYPTREDFEADIADGNLTTGYADGQLAVIYVLSRECDPEYAKADWSNATGRYFVIHRLCVSPKFQHRGIAGQTLLQIETEAGSLGADSLRLDVFSQNPFALQLYMHAGYHRTGSADWRMGLFYLMEKVL